MIKTLHAGYILDGVRERLLSKNDDIDWNDVLRSLSEFTLETTENLNNEKLEPIVAVADNIISRGLPTKPSLFIEESFANILKVTNRFTNEKVGYFSFKLDENFSNETLKRAFFIIDPRLHPRTNSNHRLHFSINTWELHPGSEHEERFLYQILPDNCGEYAAQLLEPQRTMRSIIDFTGRKKEIFDRTLSNVQGFYNQTVDFTIQLPKTENKKSGFVIEVDGWHHDTPAQQTIDNERDKICRDIGWFPTERIKTSEINQNNIPPQKFENIREFLRHPITDNLKNNYENPLYVTIDGIVALQLALSPIAIARIQKTILELIRSDRLKLEKDIWRIAIIERDLPCGELAITDLEQMLSNLFLLEGKNHQLPKIETKIYCTAEFLSCSLNTSNELYDETYKDHNFTADILLDVSILQKKGFSKPSEGFIRGFNNPNIEIYEIRSVYAPIEERKISFAAPIKYTNVNNNLLKYFLMNIFRKIDLREGQIEILERALKGKSVISLLPTGAGKSLTYQLSALLEPGITLIVDPLKSLMKDQDDSLKRLGIDNSVFINSTITSVVEREEKTKKMTEGFYQFVFISPERLQIEKFRDWLKEMANNHTHFSLCVVDEAHCVSEWGHDFRTAYLKVGKNARKHCKTGDDSEIPLLGLTGTASFDVLSDVQRELDLDNDESTVIRPKSLKRDELVFGVMATNTNGNGNDQQIKQNVAVNKTNNLVDILINKLPQNFGIKNNDLHLLNGQKTYCGLVFCPHVDWVFGIKKVHERLCEAIPLLNNVSGMYAGRLNDDNNINNQLLQDAQDKFKQNDLSLLITNKAFGMGIDKENIRYTVHFGMPPSIEAFYQEAGRAGRDRDTAYGYIIYSPEKIANDDSVDKENLMGFHKNSFPGTDKEKRILVDLLNEVVFANRTTFPDLSDELEEEFLKRIKLNIIVKNDKLSFYCNGRFIKAGLWQGNNQNRLYFNSSDFNKSFGYFDLNINNIVPENNAHRQLVDIQTATNIINQAIIYLNSLKPNAYISLSEWYNTVPRFPILYLNSEVYGKNYGYYDFTSRSIIPEINPNSQLVPEEEAREIINKTIRFLNSKVPEQTNLLDWLISKTITPSTPGIQDTLDRIDLYGQSKMITIGFENEKFQQITDYCKTITTGFNQTIVQEACKYCWDFDQFIQNLGRGIGNNFHFTNQQELFLEPLFKHIRSEQDTFKAIYRLSILGIIDDYDIDYSKRTIEGHIKKLTDDEIITNLKVYIKKYISDRQVSSLEDEVKNHTGNNALQKCLGYLVDFTYENIAKKRLAALDAMENACNIGATGNASDFQEYINTYFDSKYYVPLLKYIINYSVENIWEFIELVGGIKDELKNLRGACDRLKQENPDNALFKLLSSFSRFLLREGSIDEAMDEYRIALTLFKDIFKMNRKEYTSMTSKFSCNIDKYDNRINQLLYLEVLKDQLNWIRNYNNLN